ncbi:unnamed protein product [Paramecium primaurelia]|uniref:Uncharacterized protein n=1 Tax=Paramecium primaurelia TaxID=5886 RepID=A0A8S1NZZ3_PARPR|nr:unnamed protein product [Paramecium primaurelia]
MNDLYIWEEIGLQKKDLKLKKTYLQIQFNQKNKKIKYIKNGEILRQYIDENVGEQQNKLSLKHNNIINLEHIKYLTWKCELKNDERELHIAYWDGRPLIVGGFYNQIGQKIEKWIELSDYFWDRCEIIHQGYYKDGIKFGQWDTILKKQIIGGGFFDEFGKKQGKWIELHQNFHNESEVKLIGEYKDGKELGRWDIIFKNKIIGGGQYDNDGLKVGYWIELHENFYEYCQVFYKGEYVNGKKNGKWDSYDKKKLIGGGFFNQNGQKDGKWIELHDDYWQFCQVTYIGEYSNGIKQSQWISKYYLKQFGGGQYDEFGQKQGRWVDLHDNFHNGCQVTLVGEYQNNKKLGQWDIMYMEQGSNEFKKIGGGIYVENEIKVGFWIELHEYFCDTYQIIYCGEYKNGCKNGNFDMKFKKQYENEYKKIGGGTFDEEGLKDGEWIELSKHFCFFSFDTCITQYKNGVKIKINEKQ